MDRMTRSFRDFRVPGTLLAALLIAGCSAAGPTATTPATAAGSTLAPGATATAAASAPGGSPPASSVPAATGSGAPTTAPTGTPTATGTLPPTATPTVAPTDTPAPTLKHPDWPVGAIGTGAAKNHEGQTETVCGKVVGAQWVFGAKGHPTFLNLDKAYPNLKFNAVVWGVDRRDFSLANKPEIKYMGKTICVTGIVTSYLTYFQIQNVAKENIVVVPD